MSLMKAYRLLYIRLSARCLSFDMEERHRDEKISEIRILVLR